LNGPVEPPFYCNLLDAGYRAAGKIAASRARTSGAMSSGLVTSPLESAECAIDSGGSAPRRRMAAAAAAHARHFSSDWRWRRQQLLRTRVDASSRSP